VQEHSSSLQRSHGRRVVGKMCRQYEGRMMRPSTRSEREKQLQLAGYTDLLSAAF